MTPTDDKEAWKAYPHHRKWFNKLYLADLMGYKCGPAGVAPQELGPYIVRPIYNLSGMGVGSRIEQIDSNDCTLVEPGYFWCEYLPGKHYSATYEFVHDDVGTWKPISCWEGVNNPGNLSKFVEWKRSDFIPNVPRIFNVLSDVKVINIEFKGQNPIEVHLRHSPDPDYDHVIPLWESDGDVTQGKAADYINNRGYRFIPSADDADGRLKDPRVGFLVK